MLEVIEVETGPKPTGSVIWLHGLGADGHDFEPLVPELVRRDERALRFIFPHAPMRALTLNGGLRMRAWYDIIGLASDVEQDEAGMRESQAGVEALIAREGERGVGPERVVLAGFSQGGAIALYTGTRYPRPLAGLIGLSCYLPRSAEFARERSAASLATPIFLAHGREDPMVHLSLGEQARALLEQSGYSVEWHVYRMPHAVCAEEIAAVASLLRRAL